VKAARHGRRVFAGERHAQRVGRAVRLLRGEHAAERLLALGERTFEERAPRADRGGLAADLLSLGLELGERAVRRRNRALGLAQRVARLLADLLLPVELPGERVDAAAKRLQVFLLRGRRCGPGPQRKRKKKDAPQALAFPCAETAAMRLATSAWSPR
jgi:hypothetical protein